MDRRCGVTGWHGRPGVSLVVAAGEELRGAYTHPAFRRAGHALLSALTLGCTKGEAVTEEGGRLLLALAKERLRRRLLAAAAPVDVAPLLVAEGWRVATSTGLALDDDTQIELRAPPGRAAWSREFGKSAQWAEVFAHIGWTPPNEDACYELLDRLGW